MRALEKDPARRYPDADAFIAALQAARDGTATAVLAPVPPPPLDPPSEAYAYPEEPLAPREPREGGRWWLWLLAVLVAGLGPRRRAPAARHAEGHRAHGGRRRPGQRRGQAAPGRLPASTRVPKTAEQPAGQVIGQDPTGGTKAKKGSTVTLTVSAGPQQVAVPQVVGLTVSSARGRLQKAGLQASEREENSDTVDEGPRDLGQPERGPEGRQGLVGHARRLQRQAAGPASPTSSARASTRRSRPCRRPGSRSRAPTRRRRQGPGHRALAEPEGRHAGSTRARRSRSRWPRRRARSPCPT